MADDRKKRGYERFARAPSAVPEEFADEDKTPLPVSAEEAIEWHRLTERVTRLELGHAAFQQSFPRLEAMFNEFALPEVKRLMAHVDDLIKRQERNSQRLETFFDEQWPKLCKSVESIVEQHALIKQEQAEFAALLEAHERRIHNAERSLDELERWRISQDRKDAEHTAATNAVTTERRKWISWANAGYVAATAIGAGLTALAHYL